MSSFNEAVLMKNVAADLSKSYALQRIVAVSLDVLLDQIEEHEQAIVGRYGTELLELLHICSKDKGIKKQVED